MSGGMRHSDFSLEVASKKTTRGLGLRPAVRNPISTGEPSILSTLSAERFAALYCVTYCDEEIGTAYSLKCALWRSCQSTVIP